MIRSIFQQSPADFEAAPLARGAALAAHFGNPAGEYEIAVSAAGLFDRSDRGLAVVKGPDRAAWLHNMLTNAVKTVDANAGVYAFALDVRGRVQFDVNVLVLPDEIWLDLDLAALPAALAHLNKFLIMEKAEIADASARFARLGVSGPQAGAVAAMLGLANFDALPALESTWIDGGATRVFRHDFSGLPGFELIVPVDSASAWWSRLADQLQIRPVGFDVLNVLRMEAGIPWLGRDIDDKTVAPETGQVERAISYKKGCYLGQEVVERMRSHGTQARRLVKLTAEHAAGLPLPAPLRLMDADQDVGRITSIAKHPNKNGWVGLGYLRTAIETPVVLRAGGNSVPVLVSG